ncbi:hypothetical protein FE257_002492 [Aspergillus nanangensis]|uniref:Peptide hydrolase n=1 Tax=Aspergillus nanangensis TaxID=2582783 RepID=A0AAD4CT51_ASPNN|nr:hypothetical protein FE257_002492 [Aspergillus nanangensis]
MKITSDMPLNQRTQTFLLLLLSWIGLVTAYKTLTNETLTLLPRPGNDFNIHHGKLLAPILKPRVPETGNSTAVRNHFVKFFHDTLPDWKIELHNSSAKTPLSHQKETRFVNFVASRDPPEVYPGNVGRLTVVAHYDSKVTPKGFIGAIDSAAPCAIIMHAVRSIDKALTRKWNSVHVAADQQRHRKVEGIQVIFTDGEEELGDGSDPGDSLYGSRALAQDWASQKYAQGSTYTSRINSIALFVLLDLLGSPRPRIPSSFKETHDAYQHLARLEIRLAELNLMKSSEMWGTWFVDANKRTEELYPLGITDDHVPFLKHGVDVLHLIDYDWRRGGFPEVWHTLDDDAQHLEMAVVEDWSLLLTGFIAEWLELEGYMDDRDEMAGR